MKVEVTFKLVYDLYLENYNTNDYREAVAFDFENEDGLQFMIDYAEDVFLVDVQPYVGDKNEVALEAEIMSKTLGLETDG